MSHQPLPLHGNGGGELPPPLVMRHLERHSKDPLPSITPTRSSRGVSPPEVPEDDSPTVTKTNLDESPTALVGSLAAARRRARNANPSQPPNNSVSPANIGSGPSSPTQMQLESLADAEDKLESGGRVKAGHKTCAALLDVLDPDADGSMIVDVIQSRPPAEHSHRPPAGGSVIPGNRAPRPTF